MRCNLISQEPRRILLSASQLTSMLTRRRRLSLNTRGSSTLDDGHVMMKMHHLPFHCQPMFLSRPSSNDHCPLTTPHFRTTWMLSISRPPLHWPAPVPAPILIHPLFIHLIISIITLARINILTMVVCRIPLNLESGLPHVSNYLLHIVPYCCHSTDSFT